MQTAVHNTFRPAENLLNQTTSTTLQQKVIDTSEGLPSKFKPHFVNCHLQFYFIHNQTTQNFTCKTRPITHNQAAFIELYSAHDPYKNSRVYSRRNSKTKNTKCNKISIVHKSRYESTLEFCAGFDRKKKK